MFYKYCRFFQMNVSSVQTFNLWSTSASPLPSLFSLQTIPAYNPAMFHDYSYNWMQGYYS